MKVLLIEPTINSYAFLPPIALTVLKGYLATKTSHHAKIVDLMFHKQDWKNIIVDAIQKESPDLVGFSVLSFNYQEALTIARFIKTRYSTPIIFGGVHAILAPEEVIVHDEVDMVCTGEGENVLKELLDNNLQCSGISGLWYKQNSEVIRNRPRRLVSDLDEFAFPDFTDFDMKRYFVVNNHHLPIMASRGCPYSCSYCSNHAIRKKLKGSYVRFRSVDNVMQEIEQRIREYPREELKYLYFFDDTFILNRDFVLEFCDQFKSRGFQKSLRWTVNVRANLMTDELMNVLKDAGCYQVRMGIEAGNEEIRNKLYKKDTTNQQITDALTIIKNHRLLLRLYFMIGAPYETIGMMQESLDLAQASKADDILFALLYPLPGTEIRTICEQEEVLISQKGNPVLDATGSIPVFRTKYASDIELQRFVRKVQRWQMKKYVTQGLLLRGPLFLFDCLSFIMYYKTKYDFDPNQMFRWNVERYKLQHLKS